MEADVIAYPFLSQSYLAALAAGGADRPEQDWQACHGRRGAAMLPLYLRHQSRGEYVFDFSWADAYQRHGLGYYPKLVSAIPYTPVEGPRWLGDWTAETIWETVEETIAEYGASGWHLLFADRSSREQLAGLPLIDRHACHFRWLNHGYQDFDDFLATFQSRKRKNLRKERRRISEQGLSVTRLTGAALTGQHWQFFYHCYASTYLKRGQHPYLSEAFFSTLQAELAGQLMMAIAWRDQRPVAAALYLHDQNALYGRYWGCLEEYDCLHFELCYYQGIEFAIERGLASFDPGVQGEHKLLRGFEPVLTCSLHYLVEPNFHRAVADFCRREALQVRAYQQQAREYLPFK